MAGQPAVATDRIPSLLHGELARCGLQGRVSPSPTRIIPRDSPARPRRAGQARLAPACRGAGGLRIHPRCRRRSVPIRRPLARAARSAQAPPRPAPRWGHLRCWALGMCQALAGSAYRRGIPRAREAARAPRRAPGGGAVAGASAQHRRRAARSHLPETFRRGCPTRPPPGARLHRGLDPSPPRAGPAVRRGLGLGRSERGHARSGRVPRRYLRCRRCCGRDRPRPLARAAASRRDGAYTTPLTWAPPHWAQRVDDLQSAAAQPRRRCTRHPCHCSVRPATYLAEPGAASPSPGGGSPARGRARVPWLLGAQPPQVQAGRP